MAVYNDSERVLKIIYREREIFFEALKDVVGKAALETTPEFKPYRPSTSLDKQHLPTTNPSTTQQQQPQQPPQQPTRPPPNPPTQNAPPQNPNVPPGAAGPGVGGAAGGAAGAAGQDPKNKTKQVVFEPAPLTEYRFDKEDFDPNLNYKSLLTSILAQQRKVVKEGPLRAAGKPVNLTVHLPGGKILKMKGEDTWTVEQVLTQVLKQALEEGISTLQTKPKAYLLRMAEDDGSPDEDFPPLNFTQTIAKFGKCFMLAKNPGFSEMASSTEGDATRRKTSSTPSSGTLQINLPSLQYVKVPWVGSQTLASLLVRVCKKRQLDPEAHCFQLMDSDLPISGDLTLDELGTDKLMLCSVEKKNIKKRQ